MVLYTIQVTCMPFAFNPFYITDVDDMSLLTTIGKETLIVSHGAYTFLYMGAFSGYFQEVMQFTHKVQSLPPLPYTNLPSYAWLIIGNFCHISKR